MVSWDERFREEAFPRDPAPSPELTRQVGTFPDGRALDVATGNGRNALCLAEAGYEVDALDPSAVGLRIAREKADERGVDVNWIRADATEFAFPRETYDVITIGLFRVLDRLSDIKVALRPDGILFYQGHLRTTESVDRGPPPDGTNRFAANELLHSCLDLTVLYYEESVVRELEDGHTLANAIVVARNSTGQWQTYPEKPGRD